MVGPFANLWHHMYNIAPTLGQCLTNLIIPEKNKSNANKIYVSPPLICDAHFFKDTQAEDSFHIENTTGLNFPVDK